LDLDEFSKMPAFERRSENRGVRICLPRLSPHLRQRVRITENRENPMERYNDGQFIAWYRFTKGTVRELLAMLPLQASADNRGLPLPPMLQLLLTLRFCGAGAFQIVTGDLVNVSQPTVCRTVGVVTRLIARHLFK
ncbi:hypothetical protein HPB47_015922, partial [Ixodes persulcatus]